MDRLLLVVNLFALASSVDFCSENQLPQSKTTTVLQFTKELSVREYAVDSKFKSLHCCAKGYLSIEWFKDGRAYPWPGDVSSFILYPESANQTVYTKTLTASDAGNYTCRLHNDTLHTQHNTELKVFESSGYMELPLATYKPLDVSYAAVGEQARVFCEAFVGHIDLPDAASEVIWTKKGNASFEAPHIYVKQTKRENGQIVGAYLIINNVDWSDFGTYICTISNTGDQKIVMETEFKALDDKSKSLCYSDGLMIFLIIIVFLGTVFTGYIIVKLSRKRDVTLTTVWNKFIDVYQSRIKDRFKSGMVVLYSEGDEQFIIRTFLPQLRENTNIYPFAQPIPADGVLNNEVEDLCKKLSRTVIIVSRKLVPEWNIDAINRALFPLVLKEPSYLVVFLEALPNRENAAYFPWFNNDRFSQELWRDDATGGGSSSTWWSHEFFWRFNNDTNQANASRAPARLLRSFLGREASNDEVRV